jgi:zinc protease
MRRRLALILTGLGVLGGQAGPAPAAPDAPAPRRLANGLEVIVTPLPRAQRTALALVIRVGEHHDPAGKSGLAHLIEHCLVTAAAGDCPARTYEALAQRYPDGSTAQTSDRHTLVAYVFPPERLEEELRELAARLGDLRVTADDLAREKPRVLAEVTNMFEGLPGLAAMNRARQRLLPTPSGGRRAGLPAHVEALTLEEVVAHAAKHYRAGNAVLCLAGRFDEAPTRALVEQVLGALPRGEPPTLLAPAAATGPPGIDVLRRALPPGETARATLAFAAPSPSSPDYAPFVTLLSRLFDPQAPFKVFPPPLYFAPLDEPGAAYVSTALEPGESPEAAVARLQAKVTVAVSAPSSPADATRVLNIYGLLLGVTRPSSAFSQSQGENTYLAAMGPAMRHVLGLDPERLGKELGQVRSLPLGEIAARLFDPLKAGAAVVTSP